MSKKFEEVFKALKELLEYVESEDSGIEEHDFFTDHDSDQCVLCAARELIEKHSKKDNVFYRGFSSDGLIMLTLKGVDYTFRVDSARIPGWVKTLTGKRPGSAVKKIRETCIWWRNDLTNEVTENIERRSGL
jgi:hypothetical protein